MADDETERAHRFDAFVVARGPALWRTAYLLTGDRQLAEDLVQLALDKTWKRFERVDSYEAYVRRTMLHAQHRAWRRRWRGEVSTADLPDTAAPAAAVPDPDLMAALARLPERQRAVVVLRYFDGLTEAETATALGLAVGTVKAHHSRALAALRASPLLTIQELT